VYSVVHNNVDDVCSVLTKALDMLLAEGQVSSGPEGLIHLHSLYQVFKPVSIVFFE
jgi:hypothetical protein